MKKRNKLRILSLLLTALFVLSGIPAGAIEVEPIVEEEVVVSSPQFPDAYIKITEPNGVAMASTNGAIKEVIEATVFVEESYAMVDDELVTVSSRLLSKEEVDEIGEENFGSLDNQVMPRAGSYMINNKGTLTIRLETEYYLDETSVNSFLTGTASWSGLNNTNDCPATGYDMISFAWGNTGYDSTNFVPRGTYQTNIPVSFDKITSQSNVQTWRFKEFLEDTESSVASYLNSLTVTGNIFKNYLTGNGNTAKTLMVYTHTYGTIEADLTFTADLIDGISASVNLAQGSDAWILDVYTRLPY